ncbi:MAG: hypothetical protein IJK04_09300, partial [Kiritimatiellae bacterium]|nr:hypothetical protein [Kiritimatiellia bacterium]
MAYLLSLGKCLGPSLSLGPGNMLLAQWSRRSGMQRKPFFSMPVYGLLDRQCTFTPPRRRQAQRRGDFRRKE